MFTFIRNWMMPIAMLIGCLFYPWLRHLSPYTPVLIFVMLLLTFCKISPRDLKLERWHFWLLLIQLFGSIGLYLLIAPFHPIVAQGAMVCLLCPTATAAAVITAKLGGNMASVTTYTLLANLGTAVAVPILFPLVEPNADVTFYQAFMVIFSKVFPLLICPFFLAYLLRKFVPSAHQWLLNRNGWAFYLWVLSLTIVTAQVFSSFITDISDWYIAILLGLASLFACGAQFALGKAIGGHYNERISGGQSLGQKNTILAIWMAHTYLNPLASFAPGTYVLWQHIVTSYQLLKKHKNEKRQ